jgi:phage repressor protein C with HTH and peptisase S24 domain
MSALAEHLRKAAEKRDVGELAAKVGVTPVTLYRWLSGKFDPGLEKLSELADALDVSLAWLVTGEGPMGRRQARRHARLADYDAPEYLTPQGNSDVPPIAFLESWLFRFLYGSGNDASKYAASDMNPPLLINVPDDSMEPTFRQGALVLVDRAFGIRTGMPVQVGAASIYDGIYVFHLAPSPKHSTTVPAQLLIRRVAYQVDGRMIVRCDNSKYPEEIYPREARNRPTPIGRVVWHADRI